MVRRAIRAGDVVVIPLAESVAVLGKILFVGKTRFKGILMIGVAHDRVFDPKSPPAPLTAWQLVKFTDRQAIDRGHWTVLGHDPSPISVDATLHLFCGGVFRGDEFVRHGTKADNKRIVHHARGGHIATEYEVRSILGIPEPPTHDVREPANQPHVKRRAKPRKGAIDDDRFWSMIEAAWKTAAPALAKKRPGIAAKVTPKRAESLGDALDDVIPALANALRKLSRDELVGFDRVLERKLYDLDRADVQEHTDGSDDGFLYARGFIVGMGRRHYEAVLADPTNAITDMEAEELTYLPHRVFEDRFGDDLPPSEISRETGSNKAGWR